METQLKQIRSLLFLFALLLSQLPVQAQDTGDPEDFYTISGIVRDQKSKKRIEYANISVSGSDVGTVTNEDGEFSIKIKKIQKAGKIEVSHIGYLSEIIHLDGKNQPDIKVLLEPNFNVLEEVVIRARDPRYIIEEAMKKIPANYSRHASMLTGFYRETAQKRRRYINISEAVIDIYKTPYSNNVDQDRVQIFKGRSLLSQKKSDTLIVKLLGGPNLSVYVDVVKNPDILLDKETLYYYSFKMEESTMIDDRPQYVISFKPQVIVPYALYYGKLYIDKERLAFTRAEFNLDMNDKNKATQAILKKKPFGLRFKPVEVSFLVTYTLRDNVSYLSYIRNEVKFNCDWKRRLFATGYTIHSEMVVTDRQSEHVTGIPYKLAFKPNHSLSDKVTDFMDESFWGAYNIIEPTESLESAVKKLRKQNE